MIYTSKILLKVIFIYILVYFPLFSDSYDYGNLKVDWIEKPNSDFRKLSFVNKTDLSIAKEFFFDNDKLLNMGEYKFKQKSYFYIVTHSGGESGGSQMIRFFTPGKNSKEFYQMEVSGYGDFNLVDLNQDMVEEIRVLNEKFYGLFMEDKNSGNCKITPSLYESGFSEYNFPEYYILKENNSGKLKRLNVTYDKEYKTYMKPYISKVEKRLEQDINKVYTSETYYQDIFQYYNYMKKIGKGKYAFSKIKKSNIEIQLSCSKSNEPLHTRLEDIIYKYFENN